MGEHSFTRRYRLTGVAAFAPILRAGKRVRAGDLSVAVLPGHAGASRFGLVIPKRVAPKSTTRNEMKRIAREVFRHHRARDAGLDVVLLARMAYEGPSVRGWAVAVRALLDRATS